MHVLRTKTEVRAYVAKARPSGPKMRNSVSVSSNRMPSRGLTQPFVPGISFSSSPSRSQPSRKLWSGS